VGGHKRGRGKTDARIDRVTSAPAQPPQGKQGQAADRGEQGHGAGQPKFQRVLQIGVVGLYEALSLENYTTLLRETGRGPEALKMEARAKAIRAKHAEKNPAN